MGVPPHFLNLLIRLHTGAKVQWGDEIIDSSMGVRQGSSEGPCLFLLILQACLESMTWPPGITKPEFYTTDAANGKIHGEKCTRKGTKFECWLQLFADDAAIIFESRGDMVIGMRHIMAHMKRFGLTAHVGTADVKSKTECMYFPPRTSTPKSTGKAWIDGKHVTVTRTGPTDATNPQPATPIADTSDILIDPDQGTSMHFTKLFKYLGSMITPDLKSDTDVDTRIKKAAQAFGALRSVVCDRHLATKIRGICYKVLIVTVLLHGAESWSLTEAHMQALTAFHRRCVRAMCNVNLRSTRNFKIKTATLEEKIGVETIKMSYHRRLIGWAGEVLRMPMDRLPRKLLTAWLPHKRAVGATLNWGRTLKKALEFNNLPTTSHFNHLFTLANQTVPKVRNNPDPASWLQSTKPK